MASRNVWMPTTEVTFWSNLLKIAAAMDLPQGTVCVDARPTVICTQKYGYVLAVDLLDLITQDSPNTTSTVKFLIVPDYLDRSSLTDRI